MKTSVAKPNKSAPRRTGAVGSGTCTTSFCEIVGRPVAVGSAPCWTTVKARLRASPFRVLLDSRARSPFCAEAPAAIHKTATAAKLKHFRIRFFISLFPPPAFIRVEKPVGSPAFKSATFQPQIAVVLKSSLRCLLLLALGCYFMPNFDYLCKTTSILLHSVVPRPRMLPIQPRGNWISLRYCGKAGTDGQIRLTVTR